MVWERVGSCLVQQWKDKAVTILTTIDSPNDYGFVERKVKIDNRWDKVNVKCPSAIHRYNQYMNGMDRSDQILGKNSCLRKFMRWWKVLSFHIVDIAVANSFVLFQLHCKLLNVEELKRPKKYSPASFRKELIRQLADLPEYGTPPVYQPARREPGNFNTSHIPQFSEAKRNCVVCYKQTKKALKVVTFCSAPQCNVFLHVTKDRNCFELWHMNSFHKQ